MAGLAVATTSRSPLLSTGLGEEVGSEVLFAEGRGVGVSDADAGASCLLGTGFGAGVLLATGLSVGLVSGLVLSPTFWDGGTDSGDFAVLASVFALGATVLFTEGTARFASVGVCFEIELFSADDSLAGALAVDWVGGAGTAEILS